MQDNLTTAWLFYFYVFSRSWQQALKVTGTATRHPGIKKNNIQRTVRETVILSET